MSYINADDILPDDIVKIIQKYVDGRNIYIPKKLGERVEWGRSTGIKKELQERNFSIFTAFKVGLSTKQLAEEFCLSQKSIQRIIRDMQ